MASTTVVLAERGREARDAGSGSRRQAETRAADARPPALRPAACTGSGQAWAAWSGDPADDASLMMWKAALLE